MAFHSSTHFKLLKAKQRGSTQPSWSSRAGLEYVRWLLNDDKALDVVLMDRNVLICTFTIHHSIKHQ